CSCNRAIGYDYIAEKAVMTRYGQRTMRYRAHVPPDTAAAVWYLKNRRPDRWRDSFRHEHTASPYDGIEDTAELRALLTKQAEHLGLIAPPIIGHNAKGAKLGRSGKVVRSPANGRCCG